MCWLIKKKKQDKKEEFYESYRRSILGFCLIFPQAAVCGTEGYCGCRGCLSISHAPGCGGWVSGWVGDAIHVEGWVDWGCHVCGGVRVPL